MTSEDQSEVAAFLSRASTHGGASVERIDTHTAIVFIAGTRALKLKRAVRFDYIDFSTAPKRKVCCEAEVRLNQRTAPSIYRGVIAVTRETDGSLALGGTGTPLDWLVEMTRFDQDLLFDRLAETHRLDSALMAPLSRTIASFHADADRRPDRGGAGAMHRVIEGNDAGLAEFGTDVVDPAVCAVLGRCMARALEQRRDALDARRDAGWVRQCHGDLHLGNIVLLDGQPTLFDAIEFNDDLAGIDVGYDLAFVLMDLWHRGLPGHANRLWNGYLTESGDLGGVSLMPLMPLFLACRAAVRAKTSLTAAGVQQDAVAAGALRRAALEYVELAVRLLHPPSPSLVAMGGLSGTGKSTVAREIAASIFPVPGAVIVRSDEVRKQAWGVPLLERLPGEAYTADASRRVYALAASRAAHALAGGHSVLVDAVFAGSEERDAIERVAMAAGVPFVGLWLSAPDHIRRERVSGRSNDASDADAAVAELQGQRDLGAVHWTRVDASPAASEVTRAAAACVTGAGVTAATGTCRHG